MNRKFILILIVFVLIFILSSCNCNTGDTINASSDEGIVINEVHVTERSLTEIITSEDDGFVASFNVYSPYIDSNGDMYYYGASKTDDTKYAMYYDNGIDDIEDTGIPDIDYFDVGDIIDGTIYGTIYGNLNSDGSMQKILVKYQNGQEERVIENPIEGYCFAKDGLYYQSGQVIYRSDYDGKNIETILEIPIELYDKYIYSKLAVYRGKLWYSYDNSFYDYNYPLWCYDFDNNITIFDKGGLESINNGFLYYCQENDQGEDELYRFNCETYCIELVHSEQNIYSFAFGKNYVVFITSDNGDPCLKRLNQSECKKILSANQLGSSKDLCWITCYDDIFYVTGYAGLSYNCLAEIDIDGKIISIIYEDDVM